MVIINLIRATGVLSQWVQCDKCDRWLHQICALYSARRDPEGKAPYVCPECCLKEIESGVRVPLPKTAVFGAKDLPSTMLTDHIEQRLFSSLKQEREEMAKALGKKIDEVIRLRCIFQYSCFRHFYLLLHTGAM